MLVHINSALRFTPRRRQPCLYLSLTLVALAKFSADVANLMQRCAAVGVQVMAFNNETGLNTKSCMESELVKG